MADNVTLPLTGSGDATATAATDDVGGVHYPYAKIVGAALGSTDDVIGGLTEAAPATDTASSGLNGRLQRVAQRLTSILAQLTVGASALLKAEDAAHSSGDAGVMALAVRRDSATAGGADGDYVTLNVDSGGRLYANVSGDLNSVAIVDEVNAVNAIVGALPAGDNNIGNVDVVTLPALPAGTNNIGDVDVLTLPALPAGTNAIGKLAANSGVDIGDVDVTSVVPGTGATNLGKAEDAAHSSGDVGVMMLGVRKDTAVALGADGDYHPVEIDGDGRVWVNVAAGNLNSIANVGEALVRGFAAHGAAADSSPVGVGFEGRSTNPTAVDNGDAVRGMADLKGRQVVVLNQARDLVGHQHTQIASSSSETTIVTTVASTLLDLVSLVITNQTATAVNVTIKDGTGGTTRMILALAANGGIVLNFPVPVTQSAAGNWTATLSSAAVTVNIFAQFVKNT